MYGDGENIIYGKHTGLDVVLKLLIDDGIPSRTHRRRIFDQAYEKVGVCSGSHKTHDSVVCIVQAGKELEGNAPTTEFHQLAEGL